MNQVKPLVRATRSIASLSEFNPQLLRELKGRLKGINVLITVCLSLLIQLSIIINRLGQLPDHNYSEAQYSSYCFGKKKYGEYKHCKCTLLMLVMASKSEK